MRREVFVALLVGLTSFILYLLFQAKGIYGGDGGDLTTAAATFGIPHPSGYPLYTFLGWLLSHLPLFTPAWRVGLLSSIPHALTLSIFFLLLYRLTKNYFASLFATTLIAGNYVFFLYSVIQEVYAFADLFLVALLYVFIRWEEEPKNARWGILAAFLTGLAISHHHGIVFFGASVALWWLIIGRWKTFFKLGWKTIGYFMSFLVIGLSPHIYVYFAANSSSMVNWNGPFSLNNFIRLFTLADYGVFTSSAYYGQLPYERWLGVKALFQFILTDFTSVGLILAGLGTIFLYKYQRKVLLLLIISFIMLGPFWYFYGSFLILNRFTVGNYEQFLSSPYIIIAILVGAGVSHIFILINSYSKRKKLTFKAFHVFVALFGLTLFLYPILILYISVWRFWGLPNDRTAEQLGIDILNPLPKGSILLLSRDTPLFIAQYIRYVSRIRSDVKVLHAGRLNLASYHQIIKRNFPDLIIPAQESSNLTLEFIKKNREHFPIFSNNLLTVDQGWFWVPDGLVYRLEEESKLPEIKDFYDQNIVLWSRFHDPSGGILSKYNHLMLSDVRDVYLGARVEFGRRLLRAGKYPEAKNEFSKALAYGGDTQVSDAYTLLGLADLFLGNCQSALGYFQKAREASPAPDKILSLYEGATYRDCAHDPKNAQKLFDEYEKLRQNEKTHLR